MILNNYYPQTGHSKLDAVLTNKPEVTSMYFTMDDSVSNITNSVSYDVMTLLQ
jgi:hypothetical protein